MNRLTSNAIREAVRHGQQDPSFQPICQILEIGETIQEVIISDGECSIQGNLGPKKPEPRQYDTIVIKSFTIDEVNEKKRMVVSEWELFDLYPDQRLGSPVDINEVAAIPDSSSQDYQKIRWARIPFTETQFSDWQIDVKFIDGNINSYAVHRLCLGPHSDYFMSIFRADTGFSESLERRSVIEFLPDAHITPRLFEDLLDFFYTTNCEEAVSLYPEKALPMLYLADYFGVAKLREKCLDFLKYAVAHTPEGVWLGKAYVLGERLSIESLQDDVVNRFLAKTRCLFDVAFCNGFLTIFHGLPDTQHGFWHRMCRVRKEMPNKCPHWNTLVTHCIDGHTDMFNQDIFSKVTALETIPEIECNALPILEHEKRLSLDERQSDKLTCLQRRCVHALLYRENHTPPKRKEILKNLKLLKPAVKDAFLESHYINSNSVSTRSESDGSTSSESDYEDDSRSESDGSTSSESDSDDDSY